jgi:surface antigen
MSITLDPTDVKAHDRNAESQALEQSASRKTEVEDIKWLMAHKQGRRFVARLLDKAGVYRTSFTGNSETFFREGQRNLGLFVLSEVMEVTPDQHAQMLKEQQA